jgi:hypothetical protein
MDFVGKRTLRSGSGQGALGPGWHFGSCAPYAPLLDVFLLRGRLPAHLGVVSSRFRLKAFSMRNLISLNRPVFHLTTCDSQYDSRPAYGRKRYCSIRNGGGVLTGQIAHEQGSLRVYRPQASRQRGARSWRCAPPMSGRIVFLKHLMGA